MKRKIVCLVILISMTVLVFVPNRTLSYVNSNVQRRGVLMELPEKVSVTVKAVDENGNLLPPKFTRISAFSMDWGVTHSVMESSGIENPITIELPTGTIGYLLPRLRKKIWGIFLKNMRKSQALKQLC